MTNTDRVINPLTHKNTAHLIREFAVQNIIDDWKKEFGIDVSGELQDNDKMQLYQCEETGFQFFLPTTFAGGENLYAQLQKFDWYYMYEKWEHQVAIDDLKDCQNILEIGAGSGHFIRLARDSGIQVKGIELNEAAVAAAKREGLPVERVDLEEAANLYSGTFDAVCSFQVLEHVSDPREFIEYSVRLLKPGGLLIYCVPNPECFFKYQDNLLDMPPHHMTRWPKRTFKSLEQIFPIKLEKVRLEPLAKYHQQAYISSYANRCSSSRYCRKIFFNRYALTVYDLLLRSGLRWFATGHSLYVRFRKQ